MMHLTSLRGAGVLAAFAVVMMLGSYAISRRDELGHAARPNADDLVRQANAAFAAQEYEEALKLYEQAEVETLDPGLISANKAAAYYRLGMYRAAVDAYRRCLDDDEAPASRRARAHFDLGNALVQYGPDSAPQLAEAVRSYRACLLTPDLPPKLESDARHNLELAQLLWLKAWRKMPEAQKNAADSKPIYPPEKKQNEDDEYKEVKANNGDKKKEVDALPDGAKAKTVQSGGVVQHLSDDDKTPTFSTEDALATLKMHVERIAEARRRQRNPEGPANLTTKDW